VYDYTVNFSLSRQSNAVSKGTEQLLGCVLSAMRLITHCSAADAAGDAERVSTAAWLLAADHVRPPRCLDNCCSFIPLCVHCSRFHPSILSSWWSRYSTLGEPLSCTRNRCSRHASLCIFWRQNNVLQSPWLLDFSCPPSQLSCQWLSVPARRVRWLMSSLLRQREPLSDASPVSCPHPVPRDRRTHVHKLCHDFWPPFSPNTLVQKRDSTAIGLEFSECKTLYGFSLEHPYNYFTLQTQDRLQKRYF